METNKSLAERRQILYQYMLDSVNPKGYTKKKLKTDKEKFEFVFETFRSEKRPEIRRIGFRRAFSDWIQGLPSTFNIDMEYYKILQMAKKLGYKNLTDAEETKFINMWVDKINDEFFRVLSKMKIY